MFFYFWAFIVTTSIALGSLVPPADQIMVTFNDLSQKTCSDIYQAGRLPLPEGNVYSDILSPPLLPWAYREVVLDRGAPDEADAAGVESPIVIRETDGSYTMWYKGLDAGHDKWRILRAVSPDGRNWIKTGVVMEPEFSYEGDKIDPMTVLYENDIYRMWYGGGGGGGSACYAVSPDGISWAKYSGNPVLQASSGSWDNWGAGGQHTVFQTDDGYHMIYKGYGDKDRGWAFYGLAVSPDGVNWEKQGKIISPEPDIGEAVDYRNIGSFQAGNHYCLLHTSSGHLSLFLLSSRDGVRWQKCGVIFAQNEDNYTSDTKWTTSPSLLQENGLVKMWYEGADADGRVRIHYTEVDAYTFIKRCYDIIGSPGNTD